jgi:hypothetical protein
MAPDQERRKQDQGCTASPDARARVAARLSRGHRGRAGRQSTELTARSAMPRIAGENATDCFKWAGSRRGIGLEVARSDRAAARSHKSSARVGRSRSTGFEDTHRCGMQELEQELKRLLETAWKLQLGSDRNQIFRELGQFRLRINALQERAELPERMNAPA